MIAFRNKSLFRFFAVAGLLAFASLGCPDSSETDEEPAEDAAGAVTLQEGEPCTVQDPCEEAAADVDPIPKDDPRLESALFIDARDSSSYESWHEPGARNVFYDVLEPTSPEIIEEIAAAQEPLVVVYGDGDNPDSGESLARELASYGVENVFFIEGGAPALKGSDEAASLE